MLDEADAVHGLDALGSAAALEVVVEMEAPSMVRYMQHGMVGTMSDRLNGAEML